MRLISDAGTAGYVWGTSSSRPSRIISIDKKEEEGETEGEGEREKKKKEKKKGEEEETLTPKRLETYQLATLAWNWK